MGQGRTADHAPRTLSADAANPYASAISSRLEWTSQGLATPASRTNTVTIPLDNRYGRCRRRTPACHLFSGEYTPRHTSYPCRWRGRIKSNVKYQPSTHLLADWPGPTALVAVPVDRGHGEEPPDRRQSPDRVAEQVRIVEDDRAVEAARAAAVIDSIA